MTTVKDPELYAKMAAPFATAEEATSQMEAFYRDLYELRKKHRVANVYVITTVFVKNPDGGEDGVLYSTGFRGDSNLMAPMTGWAYAGEKEAVVTALDKLWTSGQVVK